MKQLNKVARVDWNQVPVEPDADFSPEHNKKVIAETIRKNELNQKKIKEAYEEKTDERVADVAN